MKEITSLFEEERQLLLQALSEPGFSLIQLSGKVGVGIPDFLRQSLSAYEAAILNMQQLPLSGQQKYWAYYFPELENSEFADFFKDLAGLYKEKQGILVLLNYQNLIKSCPKLEQLIRKSIREDFKESNLKLIIVEEYGSEQAREKSLARGFYKQMAGLSLGFYPLNYLESMQFLAHWPAEDRLYGYSISGGYYDYLLKLAKYQNLDELLLEEFCSPNGELQSLPERVLASKLREPALYQMELQAMAEGAKRQKEIAEAAALPPSSAANYLRVLLELGLIEKRQAYRNNNPRLIRYFIADPVFRFVFYFLYKLDPLRQRGLLDECLEIIKDKLDDYFHQDFIEIAREYLLNLREQGELPNDIDDFAPWWNEPDQQIDLLGSNADTAVLAACKWSAEKASMADFEELKERGRLTQRRKHKLYLIFSKSGFSQELLEFAEGTADLYLVSLFGEA
ncbi:MAG: DUF234 domain-containing protein [Eubacteriales bacterium]|nr:DUF234 domain-containing protein [Eubacteriales bacterium]